MTRPAILVTGAADRIGRRIAQRFAASGWHVVIHHRHHPDEAAALAASLPSAEVVSFELADRAGMAAVVADLAARLPASAELTLFGLILSLVIAIPLGVVAAVRQGSAVDHICRVVVTAGVSLPVFFTGLILVYVFYFILQWSPAPLGRIDVFATTPPTVTGFYLIDSLVVGDYEAFRSALSQMLLPGVTLAIFSLAPIARITRASMISALSAEFTRTAKASGLSPRRVIVTYALRNALLPVVTTLGMVFSFLLGANVLVEKVFAWPGVGSYAVEALIASDFAPVQGFVLAMAIIYVVLNLLIDLAYGVIDPRVRMSS